MHSTTRDADSQNLALATSESEVDQLNAAFYGAIRYPWPPFYFERLADARFWAGVLDQDLGRPDRPVLPREGARVWVAGCGTNQAVITALMFPDARVVGSDVSAGSLEVAERNARQLGAANLELRTESIHQAGYEGEFDYVICTGVIHHTANPGGALARLAAALRPAGVMQLMVYNRYRRILPTAFQKAVRTILGVDGHAHDEALALARRFVNHFAAPGSMSAWLGSLRDMPDAALADNLIQPVEHSYTVESLDRMAGEAGLELLAPCPNPVDAGDGTLHWELEMGDPGLQGAYDALPDARRWAVTNLLLMGESPMLWFYLQRGDSPVPRRTTRELCEAFLDTPHVRTRTTRTMYLASPGGEYRPSPQALPFPTWRGKGNPGQDVYDALDPDAPLRETVERVGVDTGDLRTVNRLRIQLASSAFPFLKARAGGG